MKEKRWFWGLAVCLMVLVAGGSTAWGSGFALYEGSARGNALGGGLVGRADDASAIFFNPAGITQLPGLNVMAGATVIIPGTEVNTVNMYDGGKASEDTEFNAPTAPHFYATYQYSDHFWFGLGVFSSFGLMAEFDDEWAGRYNSHHAEVLSSTVNPNVAIKLNDHWSLAAGFDMMWFDIKLEQKIDAGAVFLQSGQTQVLEMLGLPPTVNDPSTNALDVDQQLTADNYFGYGFNLGLHWKPVNWLAAGVSYRSHIRQDLEGDAKYKKPAALEAIPGTGGMFNDTEAEGTIKLPDEYYLGLMIKPVDRLSLELGGIFTRWSTYDALTIKFDDAILPGMDTVSKVKDWNDVWRFNASAEYKALDWLDLRVGYVYDESPVPDETVDYLVPANDRHLYNFGLGFHRNAWTLDLSYTFLYIMDREVDQRQFADGVLESDFEGGYAHLMGLSFGYRF